MRAAGKKGLLLGEGDKIKIVAEFFRIYASITKVEAYTR